MNREEFFKAFKKRACKYGFKIDADNIREKRTGKCPICAVASDILKRSTKLDGSTDGERLGLNDTFINSIMNAADWNYIFGTKTVKRYHKKMLKLAGLESK